MIQRVAALVLGLLILAACGGGGSDDSSDEAAATTSTVDTEARAEAVRESASRRCLSRALRPGTPNEIANDFADEFDEDVRDAAFNGCLQSIRRVRLTTTTTSDTTVPGTLAPETVERVFAAAFEDMRTDLLPVIEAQSAIQSVDRLTFDPPDDLTLAVTSDYRSDDIVRDVAWDTTRLLAPIWGKEGIAHVTQERVGWAPRLVLSVNTLRITCPADFMLRLGDQRADRAEWETACAA